MARDRAPHPAGRALAVLLAGPVLAAACGGAVRDRASDEARPSTVVYAQDLEDGSMDLVRRRLGPGAPVIVTSAGPDGGIGYLSAGLLQAVRDTHPGGADGYHADPQVMLLDGRGSPVADLGRAQAVDLSPDGTWLVWGVQDRPRTCAEGDGCSPPAATVWFAPADAPDRRTGSERFEAFAGVRWADADTAVVLSDPGGAWLLSRNGARRPLPFDGRYRDVGGAAGAVLVSDVDLYELRRVDLNGRTVWTRGFAPFRTEPSWSPDGSRIVVHQVRAVGGGSAETRLAVIDASSGGAREVPRAGSDGDVVWSPDGSWFAYRRLRGAGFELVLCRAADLRCGPDFRWTAGIDLLALEP